MRGAVLLVQTALVVATLLVASVLLGRVALGHSFYDPACCSDQDCAPYKGTITENDTGYVLEDGRVVLYRDPRVRISPDKQFHACILGGSIVCLYVPGRGV